MRHTSILYIKSCQTYLLSNSCGQTTPARQSQSNHGGLMAHRLRNGIWNPFHKITVAPGRRQMPFSLPQKQPELLSPVSGEPPWLTLLVHSISGVPCNTWIYSTWINHEIKGYLVGDSVVSLHKPTQASQIWMANMWSRMVWWMLIVFYSCFSNIGFAKIESPKKSSRLFKSGKQWFWGLPLTNLRHR